MSDQSWMGDDMDALEARTNAVTRAPSPAERLVGELVTALTHCRMAMRSNGLGGAVAALDDDYGHALTLARAAAFHDHAPALADSIRGLDIGELSDLTTFRRGERWVMMCKALAAYDADCASAKETT